jgi:hypothetical protein
MAEDDYDNGRDHVTTYVQSPGGMVEIASFNAKRNFLIDEHLLADMPERAEPGTKLGTMSLVGAGPGDPDLCRALFLAFSLPLPPSPPPRSHSVCFLRRHRSYASADLP